MRLNSKTARRLRAKAGYHGGTHPGYKFNGIHHLLEFPVYAKHERVITSMGARGLRLKQTVMKIRYGIDGKTPLTPEWIEHKGEDGKVTMIQKTELVPVLKPLVLNPSPKAIYRRMKRMWERLESRHV